MASKYELTISTKYVPEWSYIEAFRELFQNALDNEITNPENKMQFVFDREKETVKITNRTSVLELNTLLLGSTTKSDDKNTIGQHGEGYKIAFMVLLREGKKVTVYNYGNREIWKARLVKSRRFNGELVPTIEVEKEAFWKTVPDSDLTIEVEGITEEEYKTLVRYNLHLRAEVKHLEVPGRGRIITDEREKGNIYVKGLYVCNNTDINYGYDFEPHKIQLDRDRKLVARFDIVWETSIMWRYAYSREFMRQEVINMIKDGAADIEYLTQSESIGIGYTDVDDMIAEDLTNDFIAEYGEESVPVRDNEELEEVRESEYRPVMVRESVAHFIEKSNRLKGIKVISKTTVKEQLELLLDDIEHKLSNEEFERFSRIIEKL